MAILPCINPKYKIVPKFVYKIVYNATTMTPDKYSATWVSHSSIADFLQCPRAYYLKNVYKDPITGHKIQVTTPALTLGSVIHEVLESLSVLKVDERFKVPLLSKFEAAWEKTSGKRGGFHSIAVEEKFKDEGRKMLDRVRNNPGPLERRAVKVQADLPHYWLSKEDEIILSGKIDWLEYLEKTDSVHVIDFKTGKKEEDSNSLQLPIYYLLVHNTQSRDVSKASYWYLRLQDAPEEKTLPDLDEAHEQVLQVAKRIKLARKLNNFKCPEGEAGCFACRNFERVFKGEAEFVGVGEFNRDIYIMPEQDDDEMRKESLIL